MIAIIIDDAIRKFVQCLGFVPRAEQERAELFDNPKVLRLSFMAALMFRKNNMRSASAG